MVKKCTGQRRHGRSAVPCNSLVYRCEKCGAVGCRNNDCSSQNFKPDGRMHGVQRYCDVVVEDLHAWLIQDGRRTGLMLSAPPMRRPPDLRRLPERSAGAIFEKWTATSHL